MKDLRQITVIGLGLLGGSVSLAIRRSFAHVRVVGFSHRPATREKARELAVATHIADDLPGSVAGSDMVILATPVRTFAGQFSEMGPALKEGAVVTDVGSTKSLVHRWAAARLPKTAYYVGSHPIAGSEQRGVEFSRDDLFDQATCIITTTPRTSNEAAEVVERFWQRLGCLTQVMTPQRHDRIFAAVSHVPHLVAAALVNATDPANLKQAGKGFIDTSRIASGPPNIWTDIVTTNTRNIVAGIDRVIDSLNAIKKAVGDEDGEEIMALLERARKRRAELIEYKLSRKELD